MDELFDSDDEWCSEDPKDGRRASRGFNPRAEASLVDRYVTLPYV